MSERISNKNEKLVQPESHKTHYEKAKEDLERKAELSPDQKNIAEKAREVAEREALSKEEIEKSSRTEKEQSPPVLLTKDVRQQSFNTTMKSVRKKLPKSEASFSKVIHNPTIDKISEVVGETIGRPSAIYGGAITATIGLIVVYWFARRNGFQLSGYEFLILLVVGMLLGVTFEFAYYGFQKIITRKK